MKILLATIISFSFALPAFANGQYQEYLEKVFSSPSETKQDFSKLQLSKELQAWLKQVDMILDTDKLISYDAKFSFTLDHEGNIKSLEILDLSEDDFPKFKDFISDLLAIKFPEFALGSLTDYSFSLEGDSLYIERPYQNPVSLKASISKNLDGKLELLDEAKFSLFKPKFLDHPYLGQEIILKNQEGLFLKTYVTKKKSSKISLKAFQAFDDDEIKLVDLGFELKREDDKNFVAELLQSGIANGLKAGLINSYNSYGIAPGALAIMGMAGTALIETETEDSFSLERGEILKMKKMEKK